MRTLTIGVTQLKPFEQLKASMQQAMSVTKPIGDVLTFPSVQLLWKVLSPKRMDIINAMTGAGELSIREVARKVGRDFKAVHTDMQALLNAGVVDKAESGAVVFSYDRVHVDFFMSSAA
ncbi:MAG: glycosyl transferase family 1 [Plesiomonas shigelloides]